MNNSPSKQYQIKCETKSPGFAVHGTKDFANIGDSETAGQLKNSAPVHYCAKIDRVKVPVSGGRFWAIVDAADYHLVSGCAWYIHHSLRNSYAQNGTGQFMHRVIVGATKHDDVKIDHRDTDGLNNTRENLRIGTQSHNLANQRQRIGTKSGFKGVSPSGDRWKAEIGYRKKRVYIGAFATKEEAAAAYNAKALELFGTFARLNPVPCPIEPRAAA